MTGTIKQDAEGMASTILNLVSSVQGGGELMDNTSSFNVDEGVAKIRVPYATPTPANKPDHRFSRPIKQWG